MTDTVLVIGGTGQLGAPVVGQLRGDGYRVRALARRLPPAHDRDADLEYGVPAYGLCVSSRSSRSTSCTRATASAARDP
jgi:nucleoside-diphosphate-sugar epimerase